MIRERWEINFKEFNRVAGNQRQASSGPVDKTMCCKFTATVLFMV